MGSHNRSEDTTEEESSTPSAQVLELARRLLPKVQRHRRHQHSIAQNALGYIKDLLTGIGKIIRNILALRRSSPQDHLEVKLLARGGYNKVWLVKNTIPNTASPTTFILRLSTDESLKPHQIQNEVGWLKYLGKHCPEIPVPKVYDHSDGSNTEELAFIAEEFIDATMLCDIWMAYSEDEKETVARKIAELIVRMGELRFNRIGGMTPAGILGPTVEGHKLFKGRDRFHRSDCYDIGPYGSTKHYVLAQYDKEIYYHIHADKTMLDEDLFDKTSPAEFAKHLKGERAAAEAELEKETHDEPFVLCHNDLQGRNILMRGTEIAAVIDWEFAGSYPLSELNDLGIDVMEYESEADTEENNKWGGKIARKLVPAVAAERGWSDEDVEVLKDEGRRIIQAARTEMFPYDAGDYPEDDDEVDGTAEEPWAARKVRDEEAGS